MLTCMCLCCGQIWYDLEPMLLSSILSIIRVFYFFFCLIHFVQEFFSSCFYRCLIYFLNLVLFLGCFQVKPRFFVRFMVKPKISSQLGRVR
jgi:hypothetical protein